MECVLGEFKPARAPKNDDEFDAYVAYLLGNKWLKRDSVVLLGTEKTGSFLVPCINGLEKAFKGFLGETHERKP
jgi:predicted RNase H-like nuclease